MPLLGSVANASLVERCFIENSVEVVFHAAAYKHVPLVEANPLAGLANNVICTRVICDAARRCGLRQLMLISTDKAVRPTNVMGASKRLAELVVQAQPIGKHDFRWYVLETYWAPPVLWFHCLGVRLRQAVRLR